MEVTRRHAREWAVQMLTAADLNPGSTAEQVAKDFWLQLQTLDKNDGGVGPKPVRGKMKTFAEERVFGVLAELKELDAELQSLLQEWDLQRLGTVERAVLRLGAWELKHAEVPPAVVINEAVDLTNWFSNPKSRNIVNGVLDRLAKSLN